jgi:flavin reductase (DIM6/NTAB) family NADH-FMN oxidoreductase RutF
VLVGACLQHDSYFTSLAVASGRFAVSVLTTQQAALAGWFADPDRPSGLAQFGRVEHTLDPYGGAPLISGSLAALGCRLTACVPAGDHDFLLAEVMYGSVGDGVPLLNHGGRLVGGVFTTLAHRQRHPAARTRVAARS